METKKRSALKWFQIFIPLSLCLNTSNSFLSYWFKNILSPLRVIIAAKTNHHKCFKFHSTESFISLMCKDFLFTPNCVSWYVYILFSNVNAEPVLLPKWHFINHYVRPLYPESNLTPLNIPRNPFNSLV